jgi:hypothetical protein
MALFSSPPILDVHINSTLVESEEASMREQSLEGCTIPGNRYHATGLNTYACSTHIQMCQSHQREDEGVLV